MKGDRVSSKLGQFGAVPVRVLRRLRGEHVAAHLYAWIAGRYANSEGKAWPKRETLAHDIGVSVKSIERALEVLRSKGLVETTRRHHPATGHVIGLDYELVYTTLPDDGQSDTGDVQADPAQSDTDVAQDQNDTRDVQEGGQSDKNDRAKATQVSLLEPDPLNQIQEQEREAASPPAPPSDPETQEPEARSPEPAAVDPLEAFRFAWNALTTEPLPRCHTLTPNRRRLIRACLVERPIGDWHDIFSRVERSTFCRKNERGWIASLDWLIAGPDPALKVLEGQYDDHERAERPPTQKELDTARQMLRAWGFCRHDPQCDDGPTCVARIVRRLRGEAAA